jgi:response regulator RpfG family c-di-GMP phosphodiesterase
MIISTEEWRKYNILIVDDEPCILEQIEADLLFEGFSLFKATSGEEALQILDHQEIHVILCDQKMPGGMSGTEFLCEARNRYPYLIGIILSAFSEPEYLLSAINDAKAFHYLLKPWSKKELVKRLTQALQFYHLNLLEQREKGREELGYTQCMLTQAVRELYQTQEALEAATRTLSTISSVASQASESLGR